MDFITDGLATGRMVHILSAVKCLYERVSGGRGPYQPVLGTRDAGIGAADRRAWPARKRTLGQRSRVHFAKDARWAPNGWCTSSRRARCGTASRELPRKRATNA